MNHCDCCGKDNRKGLTSKVWGTDTIQVCGACQKAGWKKRMAGRKADRVAPSEAPPAGEPSRQAEAPAKPAKKAKAERKETCASAIRALVRKGKTNPEIWAVVQGAFGLSDDKKWYPGWYRAQMVRKGELKAEA